MSTKNRAKKGILTILIVILAMLIGISLGLVLYFFVIRSNVDKKDASGAIQNIQNTDVLAKNVVNICQKEPGASKCYERDIPKLMDTISMVDAFKVVGYVQEMDPSYQYCHTLGHALASRETLKDPTKWMDVMKSCPNDRACANSCVHGVFGEVYKNISVWSDFDSKQQSLFLSQFTDLCDGILDSTQNINRNTCFEAIGHISFFLHVAEPNASLKLCDDLVSKNGQQNSSELCYRGVFNSLLRPLEADEKEMMKGKEITKDTYIAYCRRFFGVKEDICIEIGREIHGN